ncbi:hypothetical protein EJB05_02805, partial [Eragrostis curvula]
MTTAELLLLLAFVVASTSRSVTWRRRSPCVLCTSGGACTTRCGATPARRPVASPYVFAANARSIHEFNTKGEMPYTLGLNQFGDMTDDEVSDDDDCYISNHKDEQQPDEQDGGGIAGISSNMSSWVEIL